MPFLENFADFVGGLNALRNGNPERFVQGVTPSGRRTLQEQRSLAAAQQQLMSDVVKRAQSDEQVNMYLQQALAPYLANQATRAATQRDVTATELAPKQFELNRGLTEEQIAGLKQQREYVPKQFGLQQDQFGLQQDMLGLQQRELDLRRSDSDWRRGLALQELGLSEKRLGLEQGVSQEQIAAARAAREASQYQQFNAGLEDAIARSMGFGNFNMMQQSLNQANQQARLGAEQTARMQQFLASALGTTTPGFPLSGEQRSLIEMGLGGQRLPEDPDAVQRRAATQQALEAIGRRRQQPQESAQPQPQAQPTAGVFKSGGGQFRPSIPTNSYDALKALIQVEQQTPPGNRLGVGNAWYDLLASQVGLKEQPLGSSVFGTSGGKQLQQITAGQQGPERQAEMTALLDQLQAEPLARQLLEQYWPKLSPNALDQVLKMLQQLSPQ